MYCPVYWESHPQALWKTSYPWTDTALWSQIWLRIVPACGAHWCRLHQVLPRGGQPVARPKIQLYFGHVKSGRDWVRWSSIFFFRWSFEPFQVFLPRNVWRPFLVKLSQIFQSNALFADTTVLIPKLNIYDCIEVFVSLMTITLICAHNYAL